VTTRRGFVTASPLSGAMTFAPWARAQSWMPSQPIRVIEAQIRRWTRDDLPP
jgi:hypothetical protein